MTRWYAREGSARIARQRRHLRLCLCFITSITFFNITVTRPDHESDGPIYAACCTQRCRTFLRVRERIENAHDEFNLDRLLDETARKAEATIVQRLERGYPGTVLPVALRRTAQVKAKARISSGKLNQCTVIPI